MVDRANVKVYTVNGPAAGSSSSLPDWLTRRRLAAKGKGKRVLREHFEGTIELIQGFEFPQASIRVKTTRDGHHAIATGTYKPRVKVWDLDQLSLKFERHTDAENVDFIILSDDWTKSIHLQNDRTVELHTQSGFHHRTRIPRFGRSLAYHFPSCQALFSASGNEIYRLSLDQGRFLNPLTLTDDDGGDVIGINTIDINPAHQLLAFGVEGNGTVQFWDPRSRSSVGILRLPKSRLLATVTSSVDVLPGVEVGTPQTALSVTAIASRADGLSYAIGTSTGHTLLYDIRSVRPFALKEQGYGLSVKNVLWIEGGGRIAGDGMVLSADKKVIKIWDRNSPSTNFTSITPAADLNHVHHVAGSGVLMTSNEGIQMATYYIPQLGPAPQWASFLEHITEELEDQTVRTVYEDFKFVDRSELKTLGLDRFIGTPMLKPYMHGYFMSLKLYDTARVIANPFTYAEHREKLAKERMEKMADTRIRIKKAGGVSVNKALAEKILKEEERSKKRAERKARKAGREGTADEMVAREGVKENNDKAENPGLLKDSRFSRLFEDPDFAIDEDSREYALMNPSAVAQRMNGKERPKTAVEEEEEESDKISSDGMGADESDSENASEDDDESDSSNTSELKKYPVHSRPTEKSERAREGSRQNRVANVKLVPLRAQTESAGTRRKYDQDATFGQRRGKGDRLKESLSVPVGAHAFDKGMEMSWVPSSRQEDSTMSGPRGNKGQGRRKGVESLGAGLERGGPDRPIDEGSRNGRTQRRKGIRSGSKSAFRRMGV